MQLNKGKLARAVDGHEQVQLALFGADLRDVDVEVADQVGLEARGLGFVAVDIRQAADAVTLQTAMQRRAGQMAEEIRTASGACDVPRFGVRQPIAGQLLPSRIYNQLSYFATAFIFGKHGRALDLALLDKMTGFYVHSFYGACAALRQSRDHPIGVFYPSSVAIESRPANMTEYAMAKAAGEVLYADLPWPLKCPHAQVRRLPRLQTVQRSSVQPAESGSAVDEMLGGHQESVLRLAGKRSPAFARSNRPRYTGEPSCQQALSAAAHPGIVQIGGGQLLLEMRAENGIVLDHRVELGGIHGPDPLGAEIRPVAHHVTGRVRLKLRRDEGGIGRPGGLGANELEPPGELKPLQIERDAAAHLLEQIEGRIKDLEGGSRGHNALRSGLRGDEVGTHVPVVEQGELAEPRTIA